MTLKTAVYCDMYTCMHDYFKGVYKKYVVIIGKIPLRHLVYRVLDLPPSMRPLVYDFGQLNMETEKEYIRHIVQNHVSVSIVIATIVGSVQVAQLVPR